MAKVPRAPRDKWRQRLGHEYKRVTVEYVRAAEPDVDLPESGTLDDAAKAVVLKRGRAGLLLKEPLGRLSPLELKRRQRVDQQRREYRDALEVLLADKPLSAISVADVVNETVRGNNHAFYTAYPSGLDGLFCYWATGELDLLTDSVHRLFDVVLARRPVDVQLALQKWMHRVSEFMITRQNGRLLIPTYLVQELDRIGAASVRGLRSASNPALKAKAVEDLVAHAAAFHRAGARSIHQLQRVFSEMPVQSSPLAAEKWPDPEDWSWNLARSFWQATLTCLCAVGVLDASVDKVKHRQLMVDIWYRGAFPNG